MVDNTQEEKYRDWDICEECGLNLEIRKNDKDVRI